MEKTLVLLKPSCIERSLIGEVIGRIERRGIIICGMKMMQLDESILREHYSHLVDKPFFPQLCASMMTSPVVVLCLGGVDVVRVFREMVGVTNGRKAAPGTIRGDLSMSGSLNIIHASDSEENALIEIDRFFKSSEVYDYTPASMKFIYEEGEV